MQQPSPPASRRRALPWLLPALASLVLWPLAAAAADTTAAQQLQRFAAEAGAPAQAARGRAFFTQRHAGEWACASCHGHVPTVQGRHATTGKAIAALAPAANPRAFTDSARTEKWFRRNCNDVLKRECSAGEKADVLAHLLDLQP